MDGTHDNCFRVVTNWWFVFLSCTAPTVVLVVWLCLSLTLTRWQLTGVILCLTASFTGIVLHYGSVRRSTNAWQQRLDTFAKQQAQLTALFEATDDAIITCDGNGLLLTASPATTRMFGQSLNGLVGRPITELLPLSGSQILAPGKHRTTAPEFPVEGVRADGSRFPVVVRFTKVLYMEESIHLAIIQDLAELQQKSEKALGDSDSDGQMQASESAMREKSWGNNVLGLPMIQIHQTTLLWKPMFSRTNFSDQSDSCVEVCPDVVPVSPTEANSHPFTYAERNGYRSAEGEPDPVEKEVTHSSRWSDTGRYIVGAEIGRGGIGIVHEAWDVQLDRPAGVKVLLPEHLKRPDVVRRFEEEARITSRLQHPGIVPIHERGVSPDGRPFFVMRLITGQTLEQLLYLRQTPAEELPRFLGIFLQICQAVAYAHGQGVIHRDLKPANIMVGAFGVVKVLDWGLAKVLGEPDPLDMMMAPSAEPEHANRNRPQRSPIADPTVPGTQLGTVFGTPAYLPPEQARGEIDQVDKRADVFGLGAILCEILTGLPPYTGADGREVFRRASVADVADAVARVHACTAGLDLLMLTQQCLSPKPADRPADGAGVAEVITAYLQADQHRAEADLVRFFDLSMDLFCIASTDGYFIRVNENFTRVLGYTEAELTCRPYVDFVHPDDRERTGGETVRIAGGTPSIQFMNRYRHANGDYVWLEWNAHTATQERAVYAVARDVTDRVRQAEFDQTAENTRRQLTAIVESSDDAIISKDLNGIIQSWNPGATAIFGYKAEEMLGKPMARLIPTERLHEEDHILTCLRRGERLDHYKTERVHKDGTLIRIHATISPIRDSAGQIIGASSVARDITEFTHTRERLLDSEDTVQALYDFFDNANIGLHWVGCDGIILRANRAELDLLGYTHAEYVGHHIAEFHSNAPAIDEILTRLGRKETLVDYPARLRCKDGSIREVEINSSVYEQEGRFIHTRCFTRDITERKRAESLGKNILSCEFVEAVGATW